MHIPAPDFVKFDLESAEEFALMNGDRVFREKRPTLLLELHGEAAIAAAGEFFERYAYEGIPVLDIRTRERVIISAAQASSLSGDWHMLLCLPRSESPLPG